MHSSFRVAPEVSAALAAGKPIVALESTLIAQGLPWPHNLETALDSEFVVRQSGAIPATIAVLGGEIRVGLTTNEVEALASAGPDAIVKAGRRDLGIAVAKRMNAATTVSASLWIAQQVGIGTMATGGLGGVHREAANTFDVSLDLDQLARADGMLVVCSGVKSILDIAATLELMETLGVLVVGYRTSMFPAFTTPSSGMTLEWRADAPDEAAEIVRKHRELGVPGAVVLAQEVDPKLGIDEREMRQAIDIALTEAAANGISGKAITPFLLGKVLTATRGRSLEANRALIVANAQLAATVAVALRD